MQFDWWTLALQAINFAVLVWLLSRFLYRPVKAVIDKRKALAQQAFVEADKKKAEAEAARKEFEDKSSALAAEREELLKNLHKELDEERSKVLERAKTDAERVVESARRSIEDERKAALKAICEQASALAVELASTLLREAGANATGGTILESLKNKLSGLPDAERAQIKRDLATGSARIQIVTASPLSADEKDGWAKAIGEAIGVEDKTEFTTEPEILGGAELRFPHAVLKFTWADQLEKAKALLDSDDTAS